MLVIISVFLYFNFKYDQYVDIDLFENIISEVKSAEDLPDLFYEEYEKEFPENLNRNFIQSIFRNQNSESRKLTDNIYPFLINKPNRREYHINTLITIHKIEKQTNQKQCLNWRAKNFDFLYGANGINVASQTYYEKELDELSQEEMRTLVKMLENPMVHNPMRNE